jgi:hypothetical protein
MEESFGGYADLPAPAPAPDREPAPKSEPMPAAPPQQLAICKCALAPSPDETPGDIAFNEQQTAAIVEAVSEITDVDPFIIESCAFKAPELARLFKKAATYHSELAALQEKLQKIDTSNNQYIGGTYGNTVNFKSITSDTLKITTRIQHHENRIQRLANSLIARAGMKHG